MLHKIKIMAKDKKTSEGPSCACGKEDLYEEWLKNEKMKKEPLISNKKKDKDSNWTDSDNK